MKTLPTLLLCSLAACAAQPQVWFAPLDPLLRPEAGYGGSPQYVALFNPSAPWRNAASHVNVFKIYGQWLFSGSDADLRAQFADLDRRGIALALEFGVLTTTSVCGANVEGFGGQLLPAAAQRIQHLGGTLRYVAMDEPIYYGTMYAGANACQWTADQMAADAATNIRAMLAQFPDIVIGDIEPFLGTAGPNPLMHYQAGLQAFRKALGFAPAFFHADVLWPAHRDVSDLAAARAMAASEGVPFGVLYNGTSGDMSDARWIEDALSHMYLIEFTLGTPDHVVFQSFNAYPKKLLPETDTDAFSSMIDRYFLRRTALQMSVSGNTLTGVLADAALNQPIPNVPIGVSVAPATGAGVPDTYSTSVAMPQGAQFMVVGARVNSECGCAGPVDLLLYSLAVDTTSGTVQRDFSQGLAGWTLSTEGSPVAEVEHGGLHLVAKARQAMVLNSAPVPIVDVAQVTLGVNARVAPASAGNGYFMLAFLDAGLSEIARIPIPFAPATLSLGTVSTDSHGEFSVRLPATGGQAYQVTVSFAGSVETWPAQSAVLYTNGHRPPHREAVSK